MTREERIRALAGQYMMQRDPTMVPDGLWHDMAVTAMARAARAIDAIDALPVPGEPECGACGGSGNWIGAAGGEYKCHACGGTGRKAND